MHRQLKHVLLAAVFLLASVPLAAWAQSATDLQTKIETHNKAISQLEAEIAQYQQQLVSLGSQKDTLANAVSILNLEAKKIAADMKVTEGKIGNANLRLASLGSSIQETSETIVDIKNAIGKSIREMQEVDSYSLPQLLLSGKTISDVWHAAAADASFRSDLRERTGTLYTTKTALIASKTDVEKAKAELVKLQNQLKDQRAITAKNQSEKNALLKATKNQESSYQKLVAEKEAQKTQLESDLRDFESQLKYVLDPSSLPTTGSKTFIWPLDKFVITQRFGKTVASKRLYTSGTHNGVDFGVPRNTPVRAMASGVVLGHGNTDIACRGASYGTWVLIKYDSGLTAVFGHLTLVTAETGDRVYAGKVVAYSGSSGYSTGPHLHVSVWPSDGVKISTFASRACSGKTITIPTAAATAYLDPMVYWPK